MAKTAPTAAQRATIRAELWSAATGGTPGSKLADLTVPSTVAVGTVSFAAPPDTTLAASTTYFFLVYTVGDYVLDTRRHGFDQRGLRRHDRLEHRGQQLVHAGR